MVETPRTPQCDLWGEGSGHQGPALGWLSILIISVREAEKWRMAKATPGNPATSLVLVGIVDSWPFLWLRRGLLV